MRPVPAAVSVTNRPVMFSLTPSSLSEIPQRSVEIRMFLNLHGDLQTKLHFCKSSDLPPQRREVLPVKRSGVLWKHASVSPSGSLALQTDGDVVLVSKTANALTISRKVSAYCGTSNHRHLHSGGRGSEPRHKML